MPRILQAWPSVLPRLTAHFRSPPPPPPAVPVPGMASQLLLTSGPGPGPFLLFSCFRLLLAEQLQWKTPIIPRSLQFSHFSCFAEFSDFNNRRERAKEPCVGPVEPNCPAPGPDLTASRGWMWLLVGDVSEGSPELPGKDQCARGSRSTELWGAGRVAGLPLSHSHLNQAPTGSGSVPHSGHRVMPGQTRSLSLGGREPAGSQQMHEHLEGGGGVNRAHLVRSQRGSVCGGVAC